MSGVGAPSDGECVCISACEHVCMIRFSTGSKAEIFLFAYYYDRLAVELVVTWLIFEPRKPQKSVRELFFDSSESCFSKPATGRKDSHSWLHEFAREAQAVMRREGYKATSLVAQRGAMPAQLVGQIAAGFAAKRARQSSGGRNVRLQRCKYTLFCFSKGHFWYTSQGLRRAE